MSKIVRLPQETNFFQDICLQVKKKNILFIRQKPTAEEKILADIAQELTAIDFSELLERPVTRQFDVILVLGTNGYILNPDLFWYRIRACISRLGVVYLASDREIEVKGEGQWHQYFAQRKIFGVYTKKRNPPLIRFSPAFWHQWLPVEVRFRVQRWVDTVWRRQAGVATCAAACLAYEFHTPTFASSAIDWGDDPFMYGPRDYFRCSLTMRELQKYPGIRHVLDYGCGVGNMVVRLSHQGYRVTGMDISTKAIAFIKKNILKTLPQGTVDVRVGTIDRLRVDKNSFDAIWCSEVLEHVPNDETVVKHFYRVLKPGGICVISVPGNMHFWNTVDEYNGHYRRYSEAEIRRLFEQAGFGIERFIIWGFPLTRLWDACIYYPIFRKKIMNPSAYTTESKTRIQLLKSATLIQLSSLVFYFDVLWNWTKLGKGFILVAKKV